MKTWISADLHFSHPRLIERGFRPVDYEWRIIRNWNQSVVEDDVVYVLGDVILAQKARLKGILKSLNGAKILVRGNHDDKSDEWYVNAGFSDCCESAWLESLEYPPIRVLLTHEPAFYLPPRYHFNLHGHLHNDQHHDVELQNFHRNFALETTDYRPALFEDIVRCSVFGQDPLTKKRREGYNCGRICGLCSPLSHE